MSDATPNEDDHRTTIAMMDSRNNDTISSEKQYGTSSDRREQYHYEVSHVEASSDNGSFAGRPPILLEEADGHKKQSKAKRLVHQYRAYIHLIIWLLLTGFLCAAYSLQIKKGYNQELLVLGIIYLYISLYLLFKHVSIPIIKQLWDRAASVICSRLHESAPSKVRTCVYGCIVVAVIVAIVFAMPEKEESKRVQRLIPCLGVLVILCSIYATSKHRKAINWNTIITAFMLQFFVGFFVFKTSVGHDLFQWIAVFAGGYLDKALFGAEFLFGKAAIDANTFALNVIPAMVFFASTVQILYHLGTIQWVLSKVAVVFIAILGVSGVESIVAASTPFLGACENALLLRPLIVKFTKSEFHQLLTCGFATISGSMLYGYIALGISGQALLTSCIMSIPCSIAVSKLRYPETEESVSKYGLSIPDDKKNQTHGILHAIGVGAEIGMHISLVLAANIIAILALLQATNALLTWLGNFVNIHELTLEVITGYIFVPIAWLIGTDTKDIVIVGRLMAVKIWSNEFLAYQQLVSIYKGQLSTRSEIIATYALCGFANFGTVGMQVGVLSALAPSRSADVTELVISALICGSFSTWLSAAIAGMLI
ncbi:Na+ dependent nucleoside transporter C-terminus-domain-containing protein [Mycotypha africana]|uniref:Na+ dependent nucleoside transporter C-terminus-domain-containing protein n=1 Tax=Mycotypha africana TaxID=64632 RepID=UPI002301B55C|nr:Na+ dependent nucleoside transporter C-terminus-domain-containing protein [Mycotypha africana]KAI8991820.1 Na+ dependent nucleoside transporter C-terminus-domain-containing protein [Mycotypha africana]